MGIFQMDLYTFTRNGDVGALDMVGRFIGVITLKSFHRFFISV